MTGLGDLALVGSFMPPHHKEPRSPLRGARCFGGAETKQPVNQGELIRGRANPRTDTEPAELNPSRGCRTRANFPQTILLPTEPTLSPLFHTTTPRAWRNLHPPTSVGTWCIAVVRSPCSYMPRPCRTDIVLPYSLHPAARGEYFRAPSPPPPPLGAAESNGLRPRRPRISN